MSSGVALRVLREVGAQRRAFSSVLAAFPFQPLWESRAAGMPWVEGTEEDPAWYLTD
jgi:hypothetical protein